LDLTAHHGAVRPPRRRTAGAESLSEPQTPADKNGESRPSEGSTPIDRAIESAEGGTLSNERIQILGLHTCNPIISYHNQIFTCTWADQIGTELVFASPDEESSSTNQPTEPLHRGPSFELLAANSVKILGRKAHIISNSGLGQTQPSEVGTPTTYPASETSQTPSQAGVPRRALAPSHQSQFLKKLQDLKHVKGESDTVRTVMSTRRNVPNTDNIDRLQGWTRTEAQLAEIQRLQERAANGDAEAQTTIDLMIAGLQTGSESESDSGDESGSLTS
jgi:hypothetical protein